ncbi:myb-like dna-binding domain containing protein [Stylonychia lemnae]|uniref:Myb-like dna-binding domain containing protein n=1 Tax=Stylonychia lemnae TaxID=5949 RepID=A0A078AMN3_STYLE|nr:myb-like dna-binding domain containing protein [Stylonychia lemnae]|eukprot:CDW82128.1 myb-like dna-binding domain containing protein [Stylonychia lemnae]
MLHKRQQRPQISERSLSDRRPSKERKLSRDSSPSTSQHFPPAYGDDYSYNSDDSGSQYNTESNISNVKLKKKLNDIQMKKEQKYFTESHSQLKNLNEKDEVQTIPDDAEIITITDEEANEIYLKVCLQVQNRKGYIKKNWSDDETKLLKWAVITYTKQRNISYQQLTMNDWQNIARLVPGRNDNQCHYKWQSEYKTQPQKAPWTYEEDLLLKQLVGERGQKQWQEIANEINKKMGNNKRQGKQCRERWINFLSPDIKREPWSPKEDLLLLEKQKQIGNQWAQIAKEIPGRTENQVKNRFNSMLKKIREEKTFKSEVKAGVQEALLQIENKDENKSELEEQWIEELIQRKKLDILNMPEDEEFKDDGDLNANYYSQVSNNKDNQMDDDIRKNYMTQDPVSNSKHFLQGDSSMKNQTGITGSSNQQQFQQQFQQQNNKQSESEGKNGNADLRSQSQPPQNQKQNQSTQMQQQQDHHQQQQTIFVQQQTISPIQQLIQQNQQRQSNFIQNQQVYPGHQFQNIKILQQQQQQKQMVQAQQQILTIDQIKQFLNQSQPQLMPLIDALIQSKVSDQVQIIQRQIQQPVTGFIGDNKALYSKGLGDDLEKRLQILSSFKNSMTNNSHNSSPQDGSVIVRRRCRSQSNKLNELKNNLLNFHKIEKSSANPNANINVSGSNTLSMANQNKKSDSNNLNQSSGSIQQDLTIPNVLPQNSKKFVEVRSGEILYVKENGEAYYQKHANDQNLIMIKEFSQLAIQDSPMSVSSQIQEASNSGQQKYSGLSFPVPLNPIHKKYDQQDQQPRQGFTSNWSTQGNPGSGGVIIQRTSPGTQGIFRSGSANSLFNLGTPKIDQFSPNTFLINGGGNNNAGQQHSNGQNSINGMLQNSINSPFGMTNTPPFEHHFIKSNNSPGTAIIYNGTPLFISNSNGSPMQFTQNMGDGGQNVLNLLNNGLAQTQSMQNNSPIIINQSGFQAIGPGGIQQQNSPGQFIIHSGNGQITQQQFTPPLQSNQNLIGQGNSLFRPPTNRTQLHKVNSNQMQGSHHQ